MKLQTYQLLPSMYIDEVIFDYFHHQPLIVPFVKDATDGKNNSCYSNLNAHLSFRWNIVDTSVHDNTTDALPTLP